MDKLAIAEYIIGELKKQLESNGIDVDDRHLELIVSEMLRDVGDEEQDNGEKKKAGTIYGIGHLAKHPHERKCDSESGSFLGAAAVEGTRSVLAKAICSADGGVAVDHLIGLKENLILGRRVPVGTGYKRTASAVEESPEV